MIEKIDASKFQEPLDKASNKQAGAASPVPKENTDVSIQVHFASLIEQAIQPMQTDTEVIQRAQILLKSRQLLSPENIREAIVFMCLGLSQLMFNLFGFDRGGFRQLVLLPTPRKQILLGKNLAFLPVAIGIGAIFLLIVKIATGISFVIVIASGLQLLAAFLLLSMAGNLISVLVPYRIAAGSLKPTKCSTKTNVLIFLSRMFFPLFVAPIFFPPVMGLLWSHLDWLPAAPTNLLVSAVLLALLVFFYRLSLNPLGSLLQQREKEILQIVTQEVE